jgi:glycosyltransferase EpsE
MPIKPRITILMAIYNCATTLEEAIDSLYAQTFKDFKLVLCDDASTDSTFEIAKSYADRYDNIILIRNEQNLKLAASLNRCLEYADTEYVARMDGDDISLPTRFEKQINFLDTHTEYVLVSCLMTHFDETGDWGTGVAIEKPTKLSFKKVTPFAHAPCMIRTSVMIEVGGYTVNNNLVRGQDYYLWYKIYKKGYKGYNIQEPLYKMRDDRNAMSRRTFRNRYKAFIIKKQVLKGLGLKFATFYAISSLLKGFIPEFLMKEIRKKRLKNIR